MDCQRLHDLLDDHVDGLLAAPEAEAVRDHIDRCRECRETALATSAATASLATWNDEAPPTECFDRILARIDALPPESLDRDRRHAPRDFFAKATGGFLHRVQALETPRTVRVRRFATTGMAAAAAMLAAVTIARTDARGTHRLADRAAASIPMPVRSVPQVTLEPASPWISGYEVDDGLLHVSPPAFRPSPVLEPR